MLSFFQTRNTFNKVTVKITVDIDAQEATVTVTEGGRILATWEESLRMRREWREPSGCEAWLREQLPVPGKDGTMGRLEMWGTFPSTTPGRYRSAA